MKLAMVGPAYRHDELVAHSPSERARAGYYAAPAELPIKILADRAEAASKEYNSTIVWPWPVSPAHIIHIRFEKLLARLAASRKR